MLNHYERKVAQILQNDMIMGRTSDASDIAHRTGRTLEEAKAAIDEVRQTRKIDGGMLL
ncbi:MAG: hypothetical protein K0Q56_2081 [Sporolactobacillus laevolacticus]|jgi:hypothetical protein|nr:hypothetical protein [Sporolactobacillus laevolacticus]